MSRILWMVVLVAGALALATESSAAAPTKAAFIERADRICRAYDAKIAATGLVATTESLQAKGPTVLALASAKIARLRTLERPIEDRKALARFMALLVAKRAALARDIAAAKAGRFDYANSEVDAIGVRLLRAARAYGFLSCP